MEEKEGMEEMEGIIQVSNKTSLKKKDTYTHFGFMKDNKIYFT